MIDEKALDEAFNKTPMHVCANKRSFRKIIEAYEAAKASRQPYEKTINQALRAIFFQEKGITYCVNEAMKYLQPYLNAPKRESGWQPIETAPRDGTFILAFIPYKPEITKQPGRIQVLQFHMECHGAPDDHTRLHWQEGGGMYNIIATHWMPLPKPPTTDIEGETHDR